MKKAGVIVTLVVLMATSFAVLTILPANVRAATLYVGGGGPGNYTAIQTAIDDANPGDTVYVFNGTYNENITIDKGLSLAGEDRNNTIINGSGGISVVLVTADSVGISEFTIDSYDPGIRVTNAQDAYIANNTIRKSSIGVRLISSHYNTVANNSFSGCLDGIFLDSSNANIIANNTILDVWNGIRLHDSGDNMITDNIIQSSKRAILIDSSWNITLTGNVMIEGGIIIEGELIQYWDTHTIAPSNLAGGKPVYYWKDAVGGTIPASAGQVILANCDSVSVKNQSFGNGTLGVQLGFSSGSTIANNTASDVWMFLELAFSHDNTISNNTVSSSHPSGISIGNSHRNTIASNAVSNGSWGGLHIYRSNNDLVYDNTIRDNIEYGISLFGLNDSVVANNRVLSNGDGIRLAGSHRNTIDNNTASWNERYGFYLMGSENNALSNNNVSHNGDMSILIAPNAGILLDWSANLTLFNNRMIENGIYIWGELIHYITNEIDTSNLVNGKPVHFWKQRNGGTVPANAGQVILADCTDVVVEGQDLNNGTVGITLAFSSANRIANNTVFRNWMGIDLFHSNDNSIHNNTAALNTYGIGVSQSDNNVLYHNNIIDNSNQAYDDSDANLWDNGYPSGGNNWSDYSGRDLYKGPGQNIPGADGIGDLFYGIDIDSRDRYPLISETTFYPQPARDVRAVLSGYEFENVTVIWKPSLDESLGLVLEYHVYRGEDYNMSGEIYQRTGSVPSGTHLFTDHLAGEGDLSTYFYMICVESIRGTSTCSHNQAGKFTRHLSPGPNLVSIPLIQSNESIERVLQTVGYDKAWYYDSSSQEWKWYMMYKKYRRGLWNMDHTMGIWVNVTEDSNLTVAGIVPAQTTIHLYEGWNLVSFPSFNSSYTVYDLRIDTGAVRVEGHDSSPPYHLRVLGDAEVLLVGQAYWVRVETDSDWIVKVS